MKTKKLKKYIKRRTLKRVRHTGGSKIYISGEAFKNACKYNLDDRYPIIPIDSKLQENDRVFLKQGDIDKFIGSTPSKRVHLVVHNTDETFEDSHMDKVRPYVNKVYAVNSSAKEAIQIPLGFRDNQYTPHSVLDNINSKATKNILCLLNFSIGQGTNERSLALDAFKSYDWATKDTNNNPGLHLNHKNEETKKKREEFYEKLKRTKFVICPFGAGKDTHRFYEAMFFGAIPIVKTSFLDPMYKKLGECWIVKDWSEVTEEECNRRWHDVNPFNIDVDKWVSMSGGGNTVSFITYGNNNFAKAKERITNEAKGMGIFNGTIKAYGPEDLSKDFLEKTKPIIHEGKGGGYWLWKPYIIYDMLNKLNDNDILLYADSGCTLQKQYIKRLNEYISMIKPDSNYSILAMRLKSGKHGSNLLTSKIWTTNAIFNYFNIDLNSDIANTENVLGGVILFRKSPGSLSIIRKWLDVAQERPDLFSDINNENSKKNPNFKENRHDQSVFSIIVQIPPYNKHVKIIEEEIEGNQASPIKATRKHSGGNKTQKNIKNPLISVIVPTYNRFKYLLNTIKSIKEQTYKDIEIIIVNDKSTEKEYYTHNFDGVKIIHLPKNTKEIYGYACAAHVRNEGIKASNGKYIAFCDDDDIWLPQKLELQMNEIKNSGCKISCTEGLNGDGEYNSGNTYIKHNKEKHYDQIKNIYKIKGSKLFENGYPKIWTKDFLKIHNCVLTSSLVIDKKILTDINNFKLLKNGEEDYDCWLRALDHSDIIYVDEPCVYYDNLHGYGRQYGGMKSIKLFNMDKNLK